MLEFLLWYLTISLLGLLALPIAYRFMPHLGDRGLTLARPLGLLLWGFAFWLLASLHILQNDLGGVLAALALLAAASLWTSRGLAGWRDLLAWLKTRTRLLIVAEVLFLLAFIFLAVLRSADPRISGTEKPMELAFINAILRSPSFPPADPWLSGYGISYYYFGYVLVSMLARLTATTSGVAFNLAIALVFAMAAAGSYGVVVSLLARWSRQRQAAGRTGIFSQGWALLAPLLILICSNLEGGFEVLHASGTFWTGSPPAEKSQFWSWLGLEELNQPPAEPYELDPTHRAGIWWWRASRVIQDYNASAQLVPAIPGIGVTSYLAPQKVQPAGGPIEVIDEFPFFSYYLADLHPHVLAMPFVMLAVGLALNLYLWGAKESFAEWKLRQWPRRVEFWLAAVVLGALAFFNTWDFPIYVALFSAAYTLARYQQSGWKWRARLLDFAGLAVALGVVGIALYLPFYLGFSSQAGGILPSLIFFTRGLHFWIMFGTLLTPLVFWLVWLARQRRGKLTWRTGITFALWVVGDLWAGSYILGSLGLNLSALGSLGLNNPADSFFGRLSTSLVNWGNLFLQLQGGQNAGSIFGASLLRRVSLPGTWLTLLIMLAAVWTLLKSFQVESQINNEGSPEITPEPVERGDPNGFVLLLVLVGIGLTLAPEFVYLRDIFGTRMNTIFKLYYQAWMLWGLAAAFATVLVWKEMGGRWGLFAKVLGTLVMLGGLVYPYFAITRRLDVSHASEWTLDGTLDIQKYDPDEWGAMEFLRQAPYGVIAEAVGGSYDPAAARMATHSGLPTVLGWPGHESQWRGGEKEKGSREEDINRLYHTRDWQEAQTILRRYQIRYIVVGSTELNKYGVVDATGARTLDATMFKKNLNAVYQSGGVSIYEVALLSPTQGTLSVPLGKGIR